MAEKIVIQNLIFLLCITNCSKIKIITDFLMKY